MTSTKRMPVGPGVQEGMIERPWGLIEPGDAREKSGVNLQVWTWMTE